MITITMDGQKIEVKEREILLEIAKKQGIEIPTLCYHEAIESWGGCRLCIVEITKEEWKGWSRLVTSCLYPAEDKLIVYTNSEKVNKVRKVLLDLLLARCPKSEKIINLAKKYGIYKTSYVEIESDNCIMCGLCARVCESLVTSSISTIKRGINKEVNTPFFEESQTCIGCLSCANVCPTNNIKYEQDENSRTIWNKKFPLMKCSKCGKGFVTVKQVQYYKSKSSLPNDYFELCDNCKREELSKTYSKITVPLPNSQGGK